MTSGPLDTAGTRPHRRAAALRVAVTGNMGAGKTTLARLLAACGGADAALVDADALSRQVVDASADLRRQLAAAFGADLLDAEWRLDRREVARRALADGAGRARLEAIVRPHLQPRIEAELATAAERARVVILDAPLVFEWGIEAWFDRIVVVGTATARAAARVAEGRGLMAAEVEQRRGAQRPAPPADARVVHVDNNGSLDDLRLQARQLWQTLSEDR